MQLLVIGGTSFLGRAVVEEALARGADVTTFNRGVSGDDVPGVTALRGDRTDDAALAQLADGEYDGVVDTCGFVPEVVGRAVKRLAGNAAHYVYVSSLSAVPSWPEHRSLDGEAGRPCPSDARADHAGGDYGVLKAGCERAVTEVFGERSTVVRSGLILGPHENVGRLPWWLRPHRRGRRGAGARGPGGADAADRRARPGRLHGRPGRAPAVRRADRHRTGGQHHHGRLAGRMRRGDRLRRVPDLGRRPVPAPARRRAVDRAAAVDAGRPERRPRLRRPDRCRGVGRPAHPAGRRDGARHVGLAGRGWPACPPRSGLPAMGMDRAREREILRDWHAGR